MPFGDALNVNPEDVFVALDELLERPDWYSDALCREPKYSGVVFYPARGESVREAKAVCAKCLVRDECLTASLARGEKFGIWGGLSERERRRHRRIVSLSGREAA